MKNPESYSGRPDESQSKDLIEEVVDEILTDKDTLKFVPFLEATLNNIESILESAADQSDEATKFMEAGDNENTLRIYLEIKASLESTSSQATDVVKVCLRVLKRVEQKTSNRLHIDDVRRLLNDSIEGVRRIETILEKVNTVISNFESDLPTNR